MASPGDGGAQLELVIRPDGRVISLSRDGRVLIGSGLDCAVRIEAPGVAPRHAEVYRGQDQRWWVRLIAEAGELQVNGRATAQAPLSPSTVVRLGEADLLVRSVAAATVVEALPGVSPELAARARASSLAGPTAALPGVGQNQAAVPGPTAAYPAAPPADAAPAPSHTVVEVPGPVRPSAPRPPALGAPTRVEKSGAVGFAPGALIDGRYKVVSRIATGAMGEVYRVQHAELGRPFALKVMRPELSDRPEFVARFKQEAMVASRVGQQNIVAISDFGNLADGRFYFVMEYLEGVTLREAMRRDGPFNAQRAINITVQIARALAAVHHQGIIHRDLKPENVMLIDRPRQVDFVKVVDFGIAKEFASGSGPHTTVGVLLGTPRYMSPEQVTGRALDARSDVYSLGLLLYEMLEGRPPFARETVPELLLAQVREPPPPLAQPHGGSPDLDELVLSMLAKDIAARPVNMETVCARLEHLGARLASDTQRQAAPGLAAGGPEGTDELIDALRPRRQLRWVVLGVAGVAALALAYAAGSLRTAPAAEAPPEAPAAKPAPAPAPPTPQAAAPVAPAAPAPPETVQVSISSNPEQADVLLGDVLIGQTPLVLSRPRGELMELTFSHKGYQNLTRKVRFEQSAPLTVELQRQHTARPARDRGLKDAPY